MVLLGSLLLRALITVAEIASVLGKDVHRSKSLHLPRRISFRPSHITRRIVSIGANGDGSSDHAAVRVGFIGTGTITHVTVSPRNAERAARLAAKFPSKVTIAASNQDVVDNSDIVCISVVPSIMDQVLEEIAFRKGLHKPMMVLAYALSLFNIQTDHQVISFVSTASIEELEQHVAFPAKTAVFRAIPMPPIAKRRGPFVLHPSPQCTENQNDNNVKLLFDPLGTVIEVQHEEDLKVLMATASLMAPFYNIMTQALEWMTGQGFSSSKEEDAMDLSFSGGPKSFRDITKASQTPGGLNEQNLRSLDERGFYSIMKKSLSEILDRVKGGGKR
eukprot:jgi/Bigna1/78031/fgenesh1_pg.52_\